MVICKYHPSLKEKFPHSVLTLTGRGAGSLVYVRGACSTARFSFHLPSSLFSSEKDDAHTQLKSCSDSRAGEDTPAPGTSPWHQETGSSVASNATHGWVLPTILSFACNISPSPRTSHLKGSALVRARWMFLPLRLHFTLHGADGEVRLKQQNQRRANILLLAPSTWLLWREKNLKKHNCYLLSQ